MSGSILATAVLIGTRELAAAPTVERCVTRDRAVTRWLRPAALVGALLLPTFVVHAATTLTKVKSGDWFDAKTWSPRGVPSELNPVILLESASISEAIATAFSVRANAVLDIGKAGTLVVGVRSGTELRGTMTIGDGNLDGNGDGLQDGSDAHGSVSVAGDNAQLRVGGELLIGSRPTRTHEGGGGYLEVSNGIVLVDTGSPQGFSNLYINPDSAALVRTGRAGLFVENGGISIAGHLDINDGAAVGADSLSGVHSAAVSVTGMGERPGSTEPKGSSLTLKSISDAGAILVSGGGTLSVANNLRLLSDSNGSGSLNVQGLGSSVETRGLYADAANLDFRGGNVTIANGGRVTANLGVAVGNGGSVLVSGAPSALLSDGSLVMISAKDKNSQFKLEGGGVATFRSGVLGGVGGSGTIKPTSGIGGTSTAWISGHASQLIIADELTVGVSSSFGPAQLLVDDGGQVSSGSGYIATRQISSTIRTSGIGSATVTGAGSRWSIQGALTIGPNDALETIRQGLLTVADGGTVMAHVVYLGNPELTTGAKTPVVGTIAIGGVDLAKAPGVLEVADDINIGGFGAIVFNHDSVNYAFNTAVESIAYSDGLLDQRAGTTMLTGDLDRYTGRTEVHGGSLLVNTELGSSIVTVFSGGRLGGTGIIAGGVTVRSGGTLVGAQDSPFGMTTLTLLEGANVNVGLESPTPSPIFGVRGDLTLDGTLNVSTGTLALGQGLYRLFNYGGALIDHGLDIGLTPAGNNPDSFSIFLGATGQVSLLNSGGSDDTVNFWGGGSGPIRIGGPGWSNAVGNNVPLQAARFLVLAGTPGTLTIDTAAGDLHPLGIQFAADGYVIDGDALDLAAASTTLRVGDGTLAGAAFTATITAALAGAGGIDKTDFGTLALGDANTFAGGTSISSGTLIGSAGSFGTGDIADNALLIIRADSDAALANAINGSGAFIKTGAALLDLTGTNELTGETRIQDGRLAVNGSLANSLIVVEDGATLGGSGVVGSVQVLSGGHVDPGNSPGLLTVSGNFTLDPGGVLTMQIAGDIAGVSYDVLRVLGDLDLANGFLELVFLDSFTPVIGESFDLFEVAAAFHGTNNLRIRGLPGNWQFESSFDPNSGKFTLTSSGQTADVPAPNLWSLLLVGVAAVGMLRRRPRPTN